MVLTVVVKTIMLFEHKLLIKRCFTESYSRSAFSKKGKNTTSTLFANKTIMKQANVLNLFKTKCWAFVDLKFIFHKEEVTVSI